MPLFFTIVENALYSLLQIGEPTRTLTDPHPVKRMARPFLFKAAFTQFLNIFWLNTLRNDAYSGRTIRMLECTKRLCVRTINTRLLCTHHGVIPSTDYFLVCSWSWFKLYSTDGIICAKTRSGVVEVKIISMRSDDIPFILTYMLAILNPPFWKRGLFHFVYMLSVLSHMWVLKFFYWNVWCLLYEARIREM